MGLAARQIFRELSQDMCAYPNDMDKRIVIRADNPDPAGRNRKPATLPVDIPVHGRHAPQRIGDFRLIAQEALAKKGIGPHYVRVQMEPLEDIPRRRTVFEHSTQPGQPAEPPFDPPPNGRQADGPPPCLILFIKSIARRIEKAAKVFGLDRRPGKRALDMGENIVEVLDADAQDMIPSLF